MFKRILVPVDGSPTSNKALVTALQLAREGGGRVRIVHLFDEMAYLTGFEYDTGVLDQARRSAGQVVEDALAIARSSGVPSEGDLLELPGLRLGDAVATAAIGWEADLVVVGTVGRRGLSRALLGSGAEQVIRLAPVPVLAVREPEPPAGV